GTIDQTLFIRKHKGEFFLLQAYVDDIIFGSSNPQLCREFEALMHDKFQMSAMGELTLRVLQKKDGIFLSQDQYVGDILKKFGYLDVRSANTLMDKDNPWGKDGPGKDVELHLYRSMIGSLMYLNASRQDIMFVVCACARYQVTPKECHLYAVKRIFKYLKGQPKLGLWYPKESPFDLVAYSDSDYSGVFNKRTKKVEKNLHVDFLENKLIEKGVGPNWLFDIDTLTNLMIYVLVVVAGTSSTNISDTLLFQIGFMKLIWKQGIVMHHMAVMLMFLKAIGSQIPLATLKVPSATLKVPSADQVEPIVSLTVESEIPTVNSPVPTPLGFQDPELPDIVYKVENAIEFKALMHDKFQMSAMGELTLRVLLKKDGIFLSQDQYVGDILKKFGYLDVRSANTLMDKDNPWGKDGPGKDVELHLYRSMIGSLMYLNASRPDIMFVVCACARYQVTPKECHLYAVKRIFKYLKGQPKLGLWYPKESPFDLVAYSDSDYSGST
nr:hypothetical protein [Tanacetum cinerariifolium]